MKPRKKMGKSKKRRGKMHQGYFWPMYGDKEEIVFTYSDSRAMCIFWGKLITDSEAR